MSSYVDSLKPLERLREAAAGRMRPIRGEDAQHALDRIGALEAALFDALSGLRYVRVNYPEVSGVGFDRCEGYQSLLQEYRK